MAKAKKTIKPIEILKQGFVHKFKDKQGKNMQRISNKAGRYLVLTEILLRKIPRESNKIEIILVMPDPTRIEVKELDEAPKEEAVSAKE